jgi:hypothetical protein
MFRVDEIVSDAGTQRNDEIISSWEEMNGSGTKRQAIGTDTLGLPYRRGEIDTSLMIELMKLRPRR